MELFLCRKAKQSKLGLLLGLTLLEHCSTQN